MNAKAKGTRNEHKSMALLEREGYRCTRSGASLGAWDIIGVSKVGFVLVQVKSNRAPGSVEMKRMQEFEAPCNAVKVLHIWKDGVNEPVIRIIQEDR